MFIIIGFFALIGLIAFAIYFVFFRVPPAPNGPPSVEVGTNGTGTNTGLPTSGVGSSTTTPDALTTLPASAIADGGATKTERLTSSSIQAPTLTADGKTMAYYDPADGRFYKIDADGKVTLLSDTQFPNAQTIVWDKAADAVVIEFPDGANVIFDFVTEQQTTLPAHWQDFGFSPTGLEVIAKSIATDPSARALVITSKDSSNTQVIASLGDNADLVDVAWSPNDQVVAFADTASGAVSGGLGRKMIYPVGKNEENYKGLVIEGVNFHALWSPTGSQILYDVAGPGSNYKPLLWIVDGTAQTMGNNRKSLGLNTWVEKCTFADTTTIYCAVPLKMMDNAGLQPDLVTANDSVYRVDLTSGKVRLVGYPEQTTRMSHLTVSADGRYLYYLDSQSRLQLMRLR